MLSEKQLIKKCKQYNMKAQKELYDRYAVTFKLICLRYIKPETDADDVLQEGFMKIFNNIKQFKGEGSFEGWMKRIIVNTAIYHFKKKKARKEELNVDEINESTVLQDEEQEFSNVDKNDIDENKVNFALVEQAQFSKEELLACIETLKEDFKVVFNLFFIEDYKHKDIAELLGIDEKTSRSRLNRAKGMIQKALYKQSIEKVAR